MIQVKTLQPRSQFIKRVVYIDKTTVINNYSRSNMEHFSTEKKCFHFKGTTLMMQLVFLVPPINRISPCLARIVIYNTAKFSHSIYIQDGAQKHKEKKKAKNNRTVFASYQTLGHLQNRINSILGHPQNRSGISVIKGHN